MGQSLSYHGIPEFLRASNYCGRPALAYPLPNRREAMPTSDQLESHLPAPPVTGETRSSRRGW